MEKLKSEILNIIQSNTSKKNTLQDICNHLKKSVSHYDWIGFYFKNGSKNELKLAEFAGKPTEHTIIPFGKGICGQVAVSNETFLVADVSEQENYISCGIEVKSELVVPIFKNSENIGQIDIDSHSVNAFNDEDVKLLEFICNEVSAIL